MGTSYLTSAATTLLLPQTGGTLLAAFDLLWFAPQLIAAARATNLSGISPGSHLFSLTLNLSWVLYAAASGYPAARLRTPHHRGQ